MARDSISRTKLEMKASAELNSKVSNELDIADPDECEAEASIKEFTKTDEDADSE